MVLRQGMTLVAVGSIAGMILAATAGRLLSGSPFRVTPPDARIFGFTLLVFATVGLVASYVPARGATRIRPMNTLKYE